MARKQTRLTELVRRRADVVRDGATGLFLDRNERVEPWSDAVMRGLGERLSRVAVHRYPQIEPFTRDLAEWLAVSPSQLFLTEGVSGAIKAVMEATAAPGGNVVFPTPTFALYPVFARMHELEARTVGYDADFELRLDELLAAIDARTCAVFLPNPNVPIEGTLELPALRRVAERCAEVGAWVAVDEVYYPFGGPTALPLVGDVDGVIVMRSVSKACGLAGVRLGCVIGAPEDVDYLSRVRAGFEANTLSMEAVRYFLESPSLMSAHIEEVRAGLDWLRSELARLGLRSIGGAASNFLFVDGGPRTEALVEGLREARIYVRSGWPEPWQGWFAVTGARRPLMQRVVTALEPLVTDASESEVSS